MNHKKRQENEKKFTHWEDNKDDSRKYWFDVKGKMGWKARYIKIVDENEITLKFYQEIYDNNGKLIEIHEKYPTDKGHRKI